MSIVSTIKRRIGILVMNNARLRSFFLFLNRLLFHWQDRLRITHPGLLNKSVLVIRPHTDTQGLLSSYLYVIKNIQWAKENGCIPYVDFESSKCQYFTGKTIQGSKNAWEYYFEQPSDLDRGEIKQARTVIYSGWSFYKSKNLHSYPKRPELADDPEMVSLTRMCPIKSYINDIVDRKYHELFSGIVLGVFIRGTDYIRLKPRGHARQPDIESVVNKIQEFFDKYDIDRVFVVTEDLSYYRIIKQRFGDIVFSSDDYFIDNYNDNKFVGDAFTNDAYERGLNYLIRILLFGRCDYTIAGITNGSIVANLLKEKQPQDAFWFDLGLY